MEGQIQENKIWQMKLLLLTILIFTISCKNPSSTNSNDLKNKNNLKPNYDRITDRDSLTIETRAHMVIPDVKVNDLELANPESILKHIGDLKDLMNEGEGLPYLVLTNKSKKIKLTLISFPGSSYNDIYQFVIEYNTDAKKIKAISDNNFITESNLKLGIKKSELLKIKGDSYTISEEGGFEVLTYKISDYNSSQFLKKYNLPGYFMEFNLKEDKVVKIKFGFDYP
jgi:hypothetical protein